MTKPLSELTTIRVGGTPASLTEVFTRDAIIDECQRIWASGEEWFALGGGSNVVIADEVSNLHIIRVANKGIEKTGHGSIRVQAGENWDDLVRYTVDHHLGGLESLSGIPGTVGAAPVQNIGAYGTELADVFVRCEFLDYLSGEVQILEKADCAFGYRDSIFKRGKVGVITWVELQMLVDMPAASGELLNRRRDEVLDLRASKGMALSEDDLDTHSCGSFFTNPIVTATFARTLPEDAPRWHVDEDGDRVKLSAAWLIEHSGITKGLALGASKAAVSNKHALAITNRGGATAAQIGELARFIQERVAATFGINLVPEPSFVGF